MHKSQRAESCCQPPVCQTCQISLRAQNESGSDREEQQEEEWKEAERDEDRSLVMTDTNQDMEAAA